MLYIGSFYSNDPKHERMFQLIVDAESIEQAGDRFMEKLQESDNEILEEMIEIYLKSIIEVKSISNKPIIINYEKRTSPFGHLGCDIPESVEGTEVHSYTKHINNSNDTDDKPFIVLNK